MGRTYRKIIFKYLAICVFYNITVSIFSIKNKNILKLINKTHFARCIPITFIIKFFNNFKTFVATIFFPNRYC